uniref:Uncharacterized protein n=1 Tax=Anopheles merus TaxID=30066 RepID=A0A182VIX5_ANOME
MEECGRLRPAGSVRVAALAPLPALGGRRFRRGGKVVVGGGERPAQPDPGRAERYALEYADRLVERRVLQAVPVDRDEPVAGKDEVGRLGRPARYEPAHHNHRAVRVERILVVQYGEAEAPLRLLDVAVEHLVRPERQPGHLLDRFRPLLVGERGRAGRVERALRLRLGEDALQALQALQPARQQAARLERFRVARRVDHSRGRAAPRTDDADLGRQLLQYLHHLDVLQPLQPVLVHLQQLVARLQLAVPPDRPVLQDRADWCGRTSTPPSTSTVPSRLMPSPASLRMSATTIWLCGTSRDHRCTIGSPGSSPALRPRAVRVSQLSLSPVGGEVRVGGGAGIAPFAYRAPGCSSPSSSSSSCSSCSSSGCGSSSSRSSSSPDATSVPFSSANTLESNVVPDSSSGSMPPHSYPPHSVSIESASDRAGQMESVVADGDCTIEQRCDWHWDAQCDSVCEWDSTMPARSPPLPARPAWCAVPLLRPVRSPWHAAPTPPLGGPLHCPLPGAIGTIGSMRATCRCSYLRPRRNRSSVSRTAMSVLRSISTAWWLVTPASDRWSTATIRSLMAILPLISAALPSMMLFTKMPDRSSSSQTYPATVMPSPYTFLRSSTSYVSVSGVSGGPPPPPPPPPPHTDWGDWGVPSGGAGGSGPTTSSGSPSTPASASRAAGQCSACGGRAGSAIEVGEMSASGPPLDESSGPPPFRLLLFTATTSMWVGQSPAPSGWPALVGAVAAASSPSVPSVPGPAGCRKAPDV